MKISRKKIIRVEKYVSDLEENQGFFIGVKISPEEIKNRLVNDFEVIDEENNIFIPKPYKGIMAQRNTVGEFVVDKSKPKETAYRSLIWNLKSWGGGWHSGTSYIAYQRYPKKFIEPFGFNFTYIAEEECFIINKEFNNNKAQYLNIKSAFNLLLELFKEVETFTLSVDGSKINSVTKRVPWEILPKGDKIWSAFKNGELINQVSKSAKILIEERFDYLESFEPDVEYQGSAGYTGYVVFGFTDKNIYVLDSVLYGNATYIFSGNWKDVSQMTKKQIIEGKLA